MADFIAEKGAGALGTRLRRLSESMDRDILALYRAQDERFEPRWFAVVTALRDHGALSVGDLAARIGVSHAAISQVRGDLIKHGLIRSLADPEDGRRQILELSAKGKRQCDRLAPLWAAVAKAADSLCAKEAPGLFAELAKLEAALAHVSMNDRVLKILKKES